MTVYLEMIVCCDQRRRDKEIIKQYLIQNGVEITENLHCADYAVLITCCVTIMTQEESENLLDRILEVLPSDKIIDIGCYIKGCLGRALKYDICAVPPSDHDRVDKVFIEAGIIEKPKILFIDMKYQGISNSDDELTWFISLGEGCSLQQCSYCIKSKSTGALVDQSPEVILKSVQTGLAHGYRRFRLVGEDIAAYGKKYNLNLPKLFDYILKNVGEKYKPIHVNAFMNGINPNQLEIYQDEWYELLKRTDLVFDGLQIAIQTFNERLLKLCNRPGNPQKWIEIIENTKKMSPQVEIWLQLIVGLPTQTEDEIKYDIDVIKNIKAEIIHIYGYSHNEGSYFYNNYEYNQVHADNLFDFTQQELIRNGEKIVYYANRSILVSRFDKMDKNERNKYYHKYRGIESESTKRSEMVHEKSAQD